MGKNQHDLETESDLARAGRLVVLGTLFWRGKGFRKGQTHTIWLRTTLLLLTFAWFHIPCSLRMKCFIFAKLAGTQFSRNAGSEI